MDTFVERKLGNLVRFANQIPNKSFRQPFPESDSAQPNQIHEFRASTSNSVSSVCAD